MSLSVHVSVHSSLNTHAVSWGSLSLRGLSRVSQGSPRGLPGVSQSSLRGISAFSNAFLVIVSEHKILHLVLLV